MARVPPFGASGHRRAASDSSLFSTGYIELEEALSRGLRFAAGAVTSEPAGVTPLALPATPRAPRLLVEEPVPEEEEEEPLEVAQADMEAPGAEEGAVLAPLRQPSRQPVSTARRLLGMARAALVEDALSHKRLLASLMVPRALLRGTLCMLAALMLIIPLVFNNALTGDELWGPFARPGSYLNVMLVRAQGVAPRPSGGPGSEATHSSSLITGARDLFVRVTIWPWSRSGEAYQSTTANATLAPEWLESFTFSQGDTRASKVVLRLFDENGGTPIELGAALLPTPPEGSPAVDVFDRDALRLPADDALSAMQGGWVALRPSALSEIDYEEGSSASPGPQPPSPPPPAWNLGEIYALVSFARRQQHSTYCEAVRTQSPVAQPANSYSNLGFCISGLHMVAVGLSDRRLMQRLRAGGAETVHSGMSAFPAYSLLNGGVQIFAGVSSFLFHASMTDVGHVLDMSGVYLLVQCPIVYLCQRLGLWGRPRSLQANLVSAAAVAVAGWGSFAGLGLISVRLGGSTSIVLCLCALLVVALASWLWLLGGPAEAEATGGHVLGAGGAGGGGAAGAAAAAEGGSGWGEAALRRRGSGSGPGGGGPGPAGATLEEAEAGGKASPLPAAPAVVLLPSRVRPAGMSYRWALASLAAIAAAWGSRVADLDGGALCQPRSAFQLHSVWHVAAAGSLWSLWAFMRSERPLSHTPTPAAAPTQPAEQQEQPPPPPPPLLPLPALLMAQQSGSALPSPRAAPPHPGHHHTRSASLLAAAASALAAGKDEAAELDVEEAEAGARGLAGGATAQPLHLRTRSRGSDAFTSMLEGGFV